MITSKDKWVDATASVKVIVAMLVGALVLSSCGGPAGPTESDTSTTQAAVSASWSTADFEDLVAHCDKVFGEPSSSDQAGIGVGTVDVDCRVVVRQNLDELGCPVAGTYEVLEETRRLIGLDIQFDTEGHSPADALEWAQRMQAELDDAYARAGCRESLQLSW